MMQVTNATWQQVGDTTPTTLVIQNTGDVRIGYVFAVAQPGVSDFVIDQDEHFILNPGSPALSFSNLSVEGQTMYARALGPKNGWLAVDSYNV